jgi:hypothetical protein
MRVNLKHHLLASFFLPLFLLATPAKAIDGVCVKYCGGGGGGGVGGMDLGAAYGLGQFLGRIIGDSINKPQADPRALRAVELNNEGVKNGDQCNKYNQAKNYQRGSEFCKRAVQLLSQSLALNPNDANTRSNFAHANFNYLGGQAMIAHAAENWELALKLDRQMLRYRPGDKETLGNIARMEQAVATKRQAEQRQTEQRTAEQRRTEGQRQAEQRQTEQRRAEEQRQADEQRQQQLAEQEKKNNTNAAVDDLQASLRNQGVQNPSGNGLDFMEPPQPSNSGSGSSPLFGKPANPTNPNLNDSSVVDMRDAKTDIIDPRIVKNGGVGGNPVNPANPNVPVSPEKNGSYAATTPATPPTTTNTPPTSGNNTVAPSARTPEASIQSSVPIVPPTTIEAPPKNLAGAPPSGPAGQQPPGNGKKLQGFNDKLASNAPIGDTESPNCPFGICSSPKNPPLDTLNPDCVNWDNQKGPRPSYCPPLPTVNLKGMRPNEFSVEQKYTYTRDHVFKTLSDADWRKLQSREEGRALIQQTWDLLIEQGRLTNNPTELDRDKNLRKIDDQLTKVKKEAQQTIEVVVLDDDKTGAANSPGNQTTPGATRTGENISGNCTAALKRVFPNCR